jgi:hypothetical protein
MQSDVNMIKVTARIPPLLKDQLDAIIAPYGGTVSAVIRNQLEEFVIAHIDEVPEHLRPEPEAETD